MATYQNRWIPLLCLTLALLSCVGPARAEVPESLLDLRDIEITVYVRRALMQDPDISRLNLGVTVQYNQATVSGRVPNREVAEQVLRIVENVKGVYQVKDALRVVSDESEKAARDIMKAVEGGVLESDLFASLEGLTEGAPQQVTTAHPDPKVWEQPTSPVVVLMPPVPVVTPVVKTPAITLSMPREEEAVNLATLIERLRFAEERYRDIRVEVSAGRVTLSGKVESAEQLIELGRALSQLPGVRNVDLRGVQVGR